EDLFPLLDGALTKQTRPTLIILHTQGSHWPYASRYPESFERYTPVCNQKQRFASIHALKPISNQQGVSGLMSARRSARYCLKRKDAIRNEYDNSILYTDYFLNTV